jgi:hypothetical protein
MKIKNATLRQNVPKLGRLLGRNMRCLMPINNLEIGEALNMIKSRVLVFMAILMLTLVGCEKVDQEQPTVYSFSGENEQLSISNGIIVLNGTEEIFTGGDLKVADDFFNNITSYSTTFYIMVGDEKDVILSNDVVDMTGDTVNISGDLGQISGNSTIRRIKIDDTSDLENILLFELTTKDRNGKENVYQLQLSLTEITKSDGD